LSNFSRFSNLFEYRFFLDFLGVCCYLPLFVSELKWLSKKWDYVKLKFFCTTKEMVSKLKRLPPEWEKIFANYILYKELITRTYMEPLKLNSQNINDPKEMGK
jgi:hypothetical protein